MSTTLEERDSNYAGDGLDAATVTAALQRVLASEDFSSAPRLSSLLEYIVLETLAGRSALLKGFNIANSVFGRNEDFDARTDPLVRVQANRLRKGLERYYLVSGKTDTVRISVPKGSYAAVFETNDPAGDGNDNRDPAVMLNPTVAVMPFNAIGDGEQEFFASGITEELTTSLAQVENFLVIGRHSTLQVMEKNLDLESVGRKLGARFILEGAVQRGATTMRITAQLTDTQTGMQLWAQKFDRSLDTEKLFEIQDEIANEVIGHLADAYGVIPRLLERETRGKRATDLESYDALLRFYHYQANPSLETFKRARNGLTLAIEKDPDFALAQAALSELLSDNFGLRFDAPFDANDQAYELARRAISLDPSCQQAHYSMAMAQFHRRERPGCLQALQRVLDLNSNAPYYIGASGWLMALVGDWERGLSIIDESRVRNPFHPTWFNVAPFQYHFGRGEFDDALRFAERVKLPGLIWDPLIRAASLAKLGRDDEAKDLIDEILKIDDHFPNYAKLYIGGYVFEEELVLSIYSTLIHAGLPAAA